MTFTEVGIHLESSEVSASKRRKGCQCQLPQWQHDDVFAYRPDIDGLRAVAVAAVVVFHMDKTLLLGGFVGVDMFFVISGYVVAASLMRHKSQTTLAYVMSFFSRRVKRLAPAMVFITCMIGLAKELFIPPWLLFSTEDYVAGQWALLGCSNIYFSSLEEAQGGYFEEQADIQDNLFMHTWSLGVEEQFYLVFPFILLAVHGSRVSSGLSHERSPFVSLLVLSGASVLSISFAGWATYHEFRCSFYNVGSRFWEMASGAILFHLQLFYRESWNDVVKRQFVNIFFQVVALGSMVVAFIYTDSERHFPVPFALLTVCGTLSFIIAGSTQKPVLNRFLSCRVLVYIGKLSYVIYLWHWPVLLFFDQCRGIVYKNRERGLRYAWQYAAYLIFLALLSVGTHHVIERPMRWWRPQKDKIVFIALFPAIGLSVLWLFLLRGPLHGKLYITPYDDGQPGAANFNNTACACHVSAPTLWMPDDALSAASASDLPYCFVEKAPSTDHACHFQKENVDYCWSTRRPSHECLTVDRGEDRKQRALFLIGDSKACHLQHVMRYAFQGIMSVAWQNLEPHDFLAIEPFIQAGDVVVVSMAFFKFVQTQKYQHLYEMPLWHYADHLQRLANLTSSLNVALVLMGDTVLLKNHAINCVPTLFNRPESCDVSLEKGSSFLGPLHRLYWQLAQRHGVFFLDFHHLLCDQHVCGAMIPGTKTHAYVDDSHFSRGGSMYLWPFICSFFKGHGLLEPAA